MRFLVRIEFSCDLDDLNTIAKSIDNLSRENSLKDLDINFFHSKGKED